MYVSVASQHSTVERDESMIDSAGDAVADKLDSMVGKIGQEELRQILP